MMACDQLHDLLKARLPASFLRKDEPLARRTTMRVGGTADLYIEPSSEAALAVVLEICRQAQAPWRVIGRGSNLLVRDGGFRGVIICLAGREFSQINVNGAELQCGAGARLKDVAAKAREASLGGLEFLEGIPGSVGGALRMNAGAMGRSTFGLVVRVRYMDEHGALHESPATDLCAEYRSCPWFKTRVALQAIFRGEPESKEAIALRARQFNEARWKSQPKEPSAGCIFKNPSPALSAGKLIDQLGLKGTRRGGAAISTVHGNFIINEGAATAGDVLALVELIKARAAEHGVALHEEVEILGENK